MLFHDHRAHWMGSQPPAAVREDPDTERRLADWSVPVVVDGQAGAITGYYRYEPPPSKALWLGVLAVLALAASVLVWRLKGPRRRLALWILAGAAVLPAPILGAAETLDLPDPGVDVAAGLAVYTVLSGRWPPARGGPAATRRPRPRSWPSRPSPSARSRWWGGSRCSTTASCRRRCRAGWRARSWCSASPPPSRVAVGAVATWRDTLARVPTKGGRARPPRKEPEEAW